MSVFSSPDADLTPEQVAERLREGEAQLIDVREPHEWEAGRIAGAVHIPLERLAVRSEEIDRGTPVVFQCRLGLLRATALANPENRRSIAALERLGFHTEGVLKAWHRHGDRAEDCVILRLMREDFENGPLAEAPVEIEGEPPPRFVAG